MWQGNSAKFRITDELLGRGKVRVLDYGAGSGKGWVPILAASPQLELSCFEPDPVAAQELRKNLGGKATILDRLDTGHPYDVIVSFSVFEHVTDGEGYLAAAKQALAPGGMFILNYDDGHFRHWVDLGNPRSWREGLSGLLGRFMAIVMPFFGRTVFNLHRRSRTTVEQMARAAGFAVASCRFENTQDLKKLYRSIPEPQRQAYMRQWVAFEDQLNTLLPPDAQPALETAMGSVTLELRHAS